MGQGSAHGPARSSFLNLWASSQPILEDEHPWIQGMFRCKDTSELL